MSFSVNRRLIRTLADIGPRRLQRRLRYDLRQHLDRRLPPRLSAAWAGASSTTPKWLPVMRGLELQGLQLPANKEPGAVSFNFLQLEQEMSWPIRWNDPNWPRLWQFHLHYFDWARDWLELALSRGQWTNQAALLEPLLGQWIEANPPGRGDGWHSYTLSLRTRNWIWLFRSCPQLATPSRIESLWHQLRWLQSHPEHCHGGNHWLENLTSLAVGGLQFDGLQAQFMYRRAMRLLQKELACQVLPDGGHEERSAAYHLLILDRLVELACVLHLTNSGSPLWLVDAIRTMMGWAKSVRNKAGRAPRFNDSAPDSAPPLDEVVAFANSYLSQYYAGLEFSLPSSGLRCLLLKCSGVNLNDHQPGASPSLHLPAVVTDLASTGWSILRPGHGWELFFKCGVPCPQHLPSHVHSDLLSFELSFNGNWLFTEAGTSVYANGPERAYERSGAAHNVLQLGISTASGEVSWIEPVEVWGGFRAARKAQPRHRACGALGNASCFAEGSHDGFDRVGACHHRRVELNEPSREKISLHVDDMVITNSPLYFRQWWHLAPCIDKSILNDLVFTAPGAEKIRTRWHSTWFSAGFGRRVTRQSMSICGYLPVGEHRLYATLEILSIAGHLNS